MNNLPLLIHRSSFALAILMMCTSSICNAQDINWFPDAGTAAKAATAENKIILLHFGAQWCRPCDELETFVFSDPAVQREFASKLIAVKVDADKQLDLVEEFGVKSLPTDIAISPDGQILSKRTSPSVATSYIKMIADIEKTRSQMDDPNSGVKNAAYQVQQMAQAKEPSYEAQTTSFTPKFPYQPAVKPAASAMALKKQSQLVRNPFVQQSGRQLESRIAGKPPGAMPMVAGRVVPQAADALAPAAMPQPLKMPGQLSLPKAMQLVEEEPQLLLAPNNSNDFSADFQPQQPKLDANAPPEPEIAAPTQLTVTNEFNQPAQPVAPRNIALQRLEQSDIAARLVREQAQQKHANFKADPKVVMDDRFYGSHSAAQTRESVAGNYQAKINLPVEPNSVDFVPPQPPQFGGDSAQSVMDRGVRPIGAKASLASTTGSIFNKPGSTTVQRGLNQASVTPAKPDYALHGKCPVALLTKSKWIDGEEAIGCVHRNRIYIFASEENLQTFQTDPDAYSPILAGYDPVIFEETGRLVNGMEEFGVFMGKMPRQRIVLFASTETRARFQLEPRKYLQTVREAMNRSTSESTTMR